MRKIALIIIVLFLLPLTLAINLNMEERDSNEIIIQGINQPATFDLKITNLGGSDNFQFYNLLGFSMAPKGTVFFSQGEAKKVELMIYPKENFDYKGFYTFKYFIRGQDNSEVSQELTIKIVNLEDVFEIGSGEINPESNSLEIYIENKENFNFGEINVKFNSVFFEFEETFSLEPKERKNFKVELDKEEFKKLMAGFYTLSAARRNDMESRAEELGDEIVSIERDGIPQEGDDNYEIYMEKTEGLRNLREVHEIERGVSGMIRCFREGK